MEQIFQPEPSVVDSSLDAASPVDNRKQKLEFNKLQKRLRRNVGKAIADFNMIEELSLIHI